MDMNERKNAIELLKFIRKNRVCAYIGDRCDCKFGIDFECKDRVMSGEKNGCPEMYQIIDILEHLPDEAWKLAIKLSYESRRIPKTSD